MKNSQGISPQTQDRTGVLVASHASVTWNSPLPPSGELLKLKEVIPDAPERLLAMAEKEQEERVAAKSKELQIEEGLTKLEERLIEVNASNIRLCTTLAFLVVLLVLCVTGYGFMKGQGVGSGILGAGGLCAFVWAFRREAHIKRDELSRERENKKG